MTTKNLEQRMIEVINKQDVTEVTYKYARALDSSKEEVIMK